MKCVIYKDELYPCYYVSENVYPSDKSVEIPEHVFNAYQLIQQDFEDMQDKIENYYNAQEASKDT